MITYKFQESDTVKKSYAKSHLRYMLNYTRKKQLHFYFKKLMLWRVHPSRQQQLRRELAHEWRRKQMTAETVAAVRRGKTRSL